MLVYRFYGDELREMFGYEQHPYAFYALASKFNFHTMSIVLVHVINYLCPMIQEIS